jgi:hypothetical protein
MPTSAWRRLRIPWNGLRKCKSKPGRKFAGWLVTCGPSSLTHEARLLALEGDDDENETPHNK